MKLTKNNFIIDKNEIGRFYKVSDNFIVSSIHKIGCSTVALQGKCYNENIDINQYEDLKYKHINTSYRGNIFKTTFKYILNNVKNSDEKVVVIYRDPIERYISTYHTYFIKKMDLNNVSIEDYHYMPQSFHYDFDDIDIFVKLEDYPEFCKRNNIPWILTNKKIINNKYKPTEEEIYKIKELYKDDYILIDKIENSNKLYKCD